MKAPISYLWMPKVAQQQSSNTPLHISDSTIYVTSNDMLTSLKVKYLC